MVMSMNTPRAKKQLKKQPQSKHHKVAIIAYVNRMKIALFPYSTQYHLDYQLADPNS